MSKLVLKSLHWSHYGNISQQCPVQNSTLIGYKFDSLGFPKQAVWSLPDGTRLKQLQKNGEWRKHVPAELVAIGAMAFLLALVLAGLIGLYASGLERLNSIIATGAFTSALFGILIWGQRGYWELLDDRQLKMLQIKFSDSAAKQLDELKKPEPVKARELEPPRMIRIAMEVPEGKVITIDTRSSVGSDRMSEGISEGEVAA